MESLDINKILQQHWGHRSFRAKQKEIISQIMHGRDVLALLPTGGGKSICFQLPGLALPGICVVVSPLIALMHDQVKGLRNKGIKAEALTSGLRLRDIDRILDNCIYGKIKFLYLSPERLLSDLVRSRLAKMEVNLIAVDEAHCISQWGYDFRPSYTRIAEVRELTKAPVMALTATATPKVVQDIQSQLNFRQPNVIQRSFHRPELSYNVVLTEDKLQKCLEVLAALPGTSIVYVRNRRRTKHVAEFLLKHGITAAHYHAGLDRQRRDEVQNAWLQGRVRVMVATNAFGMGIDKPDVRSVLHLDLPDSPEAYFQEAGRGGRDGQRAFAVCIYHHGDAQDLQHRVLKQFPGRAVIKKVYSALSDQLGLAEGSGKEKTFQPDLEKLQKRWDRSTVRAALKVLMLNGHIEVQDAWAGKSTVQFVAHRDKILDLVQQGQGPGQLLDLLIRSHGRLFEEAVPIEENLLAKRANVTTKEVNETLDLLQQRNYIAYNQGSGRSPISFLHERLALDDLRITPETLEQRKDRAMERMQAILSFAQNNQECRSKQLLKYFGEDKTVACGHCDVCRGRHEQDPQKVAQEESKLLNSYKMSRSFGQFNAEERKASRYVKDHKSISDQEHG